MTPEQFCYWLQGYAEMGSPAPNEEQWQIIKDHLQLAFKKVTPERATGPNIASPALPPHLQHPQWPYDVLRRPVEITC